MDKIIAGYVRVSTEMQAERDSIVNQEQAIGTFGKSKGRPLKIYKDAGISAKDRERPALKELLGDVKAGRVDTVVVTALDRIARCLNDLLYLKELFEENDVSFVSLSQSLDTSTPMGRFSFHILGSVAQLEREMTAQRVAENMKARALRRKWNGGVVPYGFRWIPSRKTIAVEEREAAVVRRMFGLYLRLKSFRGVVHQLNSSGCRTRSGGFWSYTTVARVLRNPVYYGALTYNKRVSFGRTSRPLPTSAHTVVDSVFDPIVPRGTFEDVRRIACEQGRIPARVKSSPYLLSGLLKCGICGSAMFGYTYNDKRKPGRSYRYHKCSGSWMKGKSFCAGTCVRVEDIESVIVGELKSFSVNPARLRRGLESHEGESRDKADSLAGRLRVLRSELRDTDRKLSRVLDLYEDGLITKDEFTRRRSAIGERSRAVEGEITETESKLRERPAIDLSRTLSHVRSLADAYEELTPEERKLLLRTVIAEIRVGRADVEYDIYGLPDVVSYDPQGQGFIAAASMNRAG